MGIYIITAAVLGLCALAFKYYWRDVLRFCYNLLLKSIDVVKKIITTTVRAGKAVMWLYRRWKNGKITKLEVDTDGEPMPIELLPPGLQDELRDNNEVIVRNNTEISPEEF